MNSTTQHIQLVKGDITTANVDAIVNAANPKMLGGGGVDGAIHRAAGPVLLEYCTRLPVADGIRCATGEARITPAGNLNAEFVIHAVGPIYGVDSDPKAQLANAYQASLILALENSCATVALPAISCGVYGFPWDQAADVALVVCSRELFQKLSLTFFLSDDDIMEVWSQALAQVSS